MSMPASPHWNGFSEPFSVHGFKRKLDSQDVNSSTEDLLFKEHIPECKKMRVIDIAVRRDATHLEEDVVETKLQRDSGMDTEFSPSSTIQCRINDSMDTDWCPPRVQEYGSIITPGLFSRGNEFTGSRSVPPSLNDATTIDRKECLRCLTGEGGHFSHILTQKADCNFNGTVSASCKYPCWI